MTVCGIAQESQGANCFNKSEAVFRLKINDIGFSFGGIRFGPDHVGWQRTGKLSEISW
jgi:hypothetical protein